jgi:hypothetical protein
MVQATPSSQVGVVPDWQPRVTWHVSVPLQKSPSEQSPLTGS